jgi:predicted dehydrogenase
LAVLRQHAELDAFTDAIAGRAAYPITSDEMLDTIAAFEALVASANAGRPQLTVQR